MQGYSKTLTAFPILSLGTSSGHALSVSLQVPISLVLIYQKLLSGKGWNNLYSGQITNNRYPSLFICVLMKLQVSQAVNVQLVLTRKLNDCFDGLTRPAWRITFPLPQFPRQRTNISSCLCTMFGNPVLPIIQQTENNALGCELWF